MLRELNILACFCSDFINEIDDFEVEMGTDFSCFPTTNEIQITVVASAVSVKEFRENLFLRTSVHNISEFTWSLLHEVGHCKTWHYMNTRTINHCKNIKRKIERGSLPRTMYYDLTDEKIATDWAIKFVENNLALVKTFDSQALKLLDEIYSKYDLED